MFNMNQRVKVVLAVEPVDLRKSFNGLYAIARNELDEIPEDGALFIFSNRSRTRIKVLCFDGTGC
jgi:transposase